MLIMKLRKMVKPVIIGVAIVFAGSLLYGYGSNNLTGNTSNSQTAGSQNVVARVNGEAISKGEIDAVVKQMVEYQKNFNQNIRNEMIDTFDISALDQVVNTKILQQEAKKEKVEVSDKAVEKKIDEIRKMFPSTDAFHARLQEYGYTLDSLKEEIARSLSIEKLQKDVRDKVKVSAKEVKDGLDEVKASHILIKVSKDNEKQAKAKAEEVLAKVKDNGDFAALAKQYSEDEGSAKQGGDLGFFKRGRMVGEFEDAAFGLKVGEVSDLVKTSYGYHIIKVTDRKEVTIKDKKEEAKVKKELLATKQDQYYAKWFDGIKKKAKLQVIDHRLKAYQLRQDGKLEEAISEFKLAAQKDTYNAYIYSNIGSIYEEQNKLDDAITNYKKAVSMVKYDADLKMHLATAYKKKNMYKEAAAELKDVAELAPKDISLLYNVKSLYEAMKMTKEAAEIGKLAEKAQQEQIAAWQKQMEQQKQAQEMMQKQAKDKKTSKK